MKIDFNLKLEFVTLTLIVSFILKFSILLTFKSLKKNSKSIPVATQPNTLNQVRQIRIYIIYN